MITLGDVSNSIYFQFRERQYQSLEKKRIGIFHVSDYVQECTRNSYYNHLVTGKKSIDTTTMGIFFAGEAVHQLLDSSAPKGMGETPLVYNFVDDKKVDLEFEGKAWGVEEWAKILVGEADSLYKLEIDGKKEWCIVDYKTWLSKGFKKREASPDHKVQVNAYNYLFKKTMDMDIKYGAIIYLDFMDRFAKPLIFPFKLDKLEEVHAGLMSKYLDFEKAIKTGELPPRTKSWKCDGYCPHAQRCVHEEKLTPEENKLGITL